MSRDLSDKKFWRKGIPGREDNLCRDPKPGLGVLMTQRDGHCSQSRAGWWWRTT